MPILNESFLDVKSFFAESPAASVIIVTKGSLKGNEYSSNYRAFGFCINTLYGYLGVFYHFLHVSN